MCLLKCTILLEKQNFRIFQHSNIRNEIRGINKNHFISSTLYISVKVSKCQNRSRPLFNTVSAQIHYFRWKSTFSNLSVSNIRNESRWVNKNHYNLTHYLSLLKSANLKTEHTHFSKLCLLKRVVKVIFYLAQHTCP